MNHFDLIVIGAGSGGLAAARRSSSLGKNVAIIEHNRLGGTCVNCGCVPKKLLHDTAAIIEALHESKLIGTNSIKEPTTTEPSPNWPHVRIQIHEYIAKLHGIYARNLENDNVTLLNGHASFVDPHTVRIKNSTFQADQFIIATGARPKPPPPIEGNHLTIVSDDVFHLDNVPARTLIMGGGYIGVEFAGILTSFGSKVTIVQSHDRILAPFDEEVSKHLLDLYVALGINVRLHTTVSRIEASDSALKVTAQTGASGESYTETFDTIISAVGRAPNVENLGLEAAGVKLDARGFIAIDEDERTTAPHIFAIGDVTPRVALTPVAVKAGRQLAERLYGGSTERMRYDVIPTAVFAPVEIGVVGLTERQARQRYGDASVRVYRTTFQPMRKALINGTPVRALIKMVVAGNDERVVGLHIVGPEAAEIIQGYAVAVTAGLTKKHFDDTIAIHPSLAEEVVTLR